MSEARITWLSGPLLRARSEQPPALYEAIHVGQEGLLGEVIRLDGQEFTAQVYEDMTGLKPGDAITGTDLPLSVRVGPGLLGGIFDGLLRPLSGLDTPFAPRGMRVLRSRPIGFVPSVAEGDRVRPGQSFGEARPGGSREQWCLVPPDVAGTVRRIAAAGEYRETEVVCELESGDGHPVELAMSHLWPVRTPRPAAQRLPIERPMITGQRVIDSLFPVGRGCRATIPGGFGTGKTVLLESLAKWCDADVIIYVGCGERGNELTGILEEFPTLEDPRNGRPLMERTVVIANTSNMPVAAREASIYTGVTVAEYFRDQGLNVALMADSTSRWAEALREIAGRLGELPGEGGYPAYLSSRLADFYERAGRFRSLGGEEGSITLMGAVSPPSGDFAEPVVIHTKRYVPCFWALDANRARARIYPAINPLISYSQDADRFASWWRSQGNTQWGESRERILALLGEQVKLQRMARILGQDALPERQQIRLLSADLITDAFLRQSSFSPVDRFASPQRQQRMLRLLMRFIDLAGSAVEAGTRSSAAIRAMPVFRRLQRMGEEIDERHLDRFDGLERELEEAFH